MATDEPAGSGTPAAAGSASAGPAEADPTPTRTEPDPPVPGTAPESAPTKAAPTKAVPTKAAPASKTVPAESAPATERAPRPADGAAKPAPAEAGSTPSKAAPGATEATPGPTSVRTTRESAAAGREVVVEVRDLGKDLVTRRRAAWWSPGRREQRDTVLDGISFGLTAGELAVVLAEDVTAVGTLVRLLAGSLGPDRGSVRVLGLAPDADGERLAGRLGVTSGTRPLLWRDLPLGESLRILSTAHGLGEPEGRRRRADLLERLGLTTFVRVPAVQLSPGPRVRAELAAAALAEPDLLVLDQPLLDLDVVSKEGVRTFLTEETRLHGRTVVLTTSDPADAASLGDRLLVLDRGRLVHDGDLPALLARTGLERTLVVDLTEAGQVLDDVPGTKLAAVEAGGRRQRLTVTGGSVPTAQVLADVAARSGIRDLTLVEPRLEDLVRRL